MQKSNYLFALIFLLASINSYANLNVVTTTQDLAAISTAIGGKHIQVQSLTLGTRDPHFTSAKPSMIRTVFNADLLLVIGADLEIGWLPSLLRSARNTQVQIGNHGYLDLSTVIPLLGKINEPVSRSMGDLHAKGNPHYWLDPRNGVRMAKAISSRLSQLDPAHKDDYQANLKRFIQTMNEKLPHWQTQLAHLKDKPVIAYHNSFIYLADAFNFQIVDEVEAKAGISPSAASLTTLVARIKDNDIKLLIMEPYYEQRSATYLSEKTEISIVVLSQSVGAQASIQNYFDLFDAIVNALNDVKEN